MEPRMKWNKIILAAKIILFHLRRGSMLKLNTTILYNNFCFISDVVPCWNKIISDPSRRRSSIVLKLFYFTRCSIMKWNRIILEIGRSSQARSVAQAIAGTWKFPSFTYRQRQTAPDYSRQMLWLAAAIASRIFMLKLFYFISDVVAC